MSHLALETNSKNLIKRTRSFDILYGKKGDIDLKNTAATINEL